MRRKQLDALHDNSLMASKLASEKALRTRSVKAGGPDPWAEIEKAMVLDQQLNTRLVLVESAAGLNSSLYRYARTLVRGAAERAKPSDERLPEYADPALPLLVQQLTAPVPVYPAREKLTMSFGLERMREFLGPDYPLVRNLMAEYSPDTLAASLIDGTKLADPAVRKQLWEGGQAAIDASTDPMIRMPGWWIPRHADSQAVRGWRGSVVVDASRKDRCRALRRTGHQRISRCHLHAAPELRHRAGLGRSGAPVAPFTQLVRAFERSTGSEPFRMPDSWTAKRAQLDMNTHSTFHQQRHCRRNSGSPLVNAKVKSSASCSMAISTPSPVLLVRHGKEPLGGVHPAIIRTALTQVYATQRLATGSASEMTWQWKNTALRWGSHPGRSTG